MPRGEVPLRLVEPARSKYPSVSDALWRLPRRLVTAADDYKGPAGERILGQTSLARVTGIKGPVLSKILGWKNLANIKAATVHQLAVRLGVSMGWLYYGDEEQHRRAAPPESGVVPSSRASGDKGAAT